MSILIKGMRMPENCIKCPMQFGGMCYVMPADVDESRVAPTVEEALKQVKPDWCPLVEIPEPHGRLIDVDALAQDLEEDVERDQRALDDMDIVGDERTKLQFDKDCKQNCMWYLTESFTVIEAEGSENHDD